MPSRESDYFHALRLSLRGGDQTPQPGNGVTNNSELVASTAYLKRCDSSLLALCTALESTNYSKQENWDFFRKVPSNRGGGVIGGTVVYILYLRSSLEPRTLGMF